MESRGYLIDTNVIIDFLAGRFSGENLQFITKILSSRPAISVISKIEVLGFNTTTAHEKLLKSFINELNIIQISPEVVDACIAIRKEHRIKLPDALIAATCVAHQITLITRNTSDFSGIIEIQSINPHSSSKS
jgi:predicted nucleic acid-binding protein